MKTLLPLIIVLVGFTSCKTTNLFQTNTKVDEQGEVFAQLSKDYEHILSPDDKIAISVWNHDDVSVGSAFSIYNTNESFGKWLLIENDSTVSVPQVGSMKLGGLTLREAEDSITLALAKTIKNPIVEMKLLNAEVTVLGEVVKPGRYLIEKNLNSLVEIIGEAQGLTSFAKKSKIQVIRDNISYTVDLTTMNDFEAQNIFLKSGDIVHVPAVGSKKFHERAPTLIPFATMLTSVGVLISVLAP